MADRLLMISSIILVVLTVIFTQFMNAEKFWQGQAENVKIKLLEKGLTDEEVEIYEIFIDKVSQVNRIKHARKKLIDKGFDKGKIVTIINKYHEHEKNYQDHETLTKKYYEYDSYHHEHKWYGRIFSGAMSFLLFMTAICLPIGKWEQSDNVLKTLTIVLILLLSSLAIVGLSFTFGIWQP